MLFLYVGIPNILHCVANEWLLQNHIQYVFNAHITHSLLYLPESRKQIMLQFMHKI